MSTYIRVLVGAYVFFISVLTLAGSTSAETASRAGVADPVNEDEIRICVNPNSLNAKSLDLVIKQTKPNNDFKPVQFTLTQHDNCVDIKLDSIPATTNSATEHVITEQSTENTAQNQIVSRISIPDIKAHRGCEIDLSLSMGLSTGDVPSISGGNIKNCPATNKP